MHLRVFPAGFLRPKACNYECLIELHFAFDKSFIRFADASANAVRETTGLTRPFPLPSPIGGKLIRCAC